MAGTIGLFRPSCTRASPEVLRASPRHGLHGFSIKGDRCSKIYINVAMLGKPDGASSIPYVPLHGQKLVFYEVIPVGALDIFRVF